MTMRERKNISDTESDAQVRVGYEQGGEGKREKSMNL